MTLVWLSCEANQLWDAQKYEEQKHKEQKFDHYKTFSVLLKLNFSWMSHDSGLNTILYAHSNVSSVNISNHLISCSW